MKHGLDGVEVIVGVHVQHSVVFVVEGAVCLGAGVVAFNQVFKKVKMAFGVVLRVHGNKAAVLQKAGVHAAACAGKAGGHFVDDVIFKPAKRFGGGQVVHRSRRLAGINRPAHHGHAQRRGLAARCHQADCCQHGHGGLAYAHNMAVAINAL